MSIIFTQIFIRFGRDITLMLSQVIIDGLESSRESEFPPTINVPEVGAISESRPTIIC